MFWLLLQVDVVVFDKTGTLTLGKMQLASIQPAAGVSEDKVLQWAAAAESSARHPLAEAVQEAAREAGIELLHSSNSGTVPGSGIRATVDGRRQAAFLLLPAVCQVWHAHASMQGSLERLGGCPVCCCNPADQEQLVIRSAENTTTS